MPRCVQIMLGNAAMCVERCARSTFKSQAKLTLRTSSLFVTSRGTHNRKICLGLAIKRHSGTYDSARTIAMDAAELVSPDCSMQKSLMVNQSGYIQSWRLHAYTSWVAYIEWKAWTRYISVWCQALHVPFCDIDNSKALMKIIRRNAAISQYLHSWSWCSSLALILAPRVMAPAAIDLQQQTTTSHHTRSIIDLYIHITACVFRPWTSTCSFIFIKLFLCNVLFAYSTTSVWHLAYFRNADVGGG